MSIKKRSELIGSHHAIAIVIGLALNPFHRVVSENAVPAAPAVTFKAPFPVPARR